MRNNKLCLQRTFRWSGRILFEDDENEGKMPDEPKLRREAFFDTLRSLIVHITRIQ
jgi:hypothetical protein